MIENMYSRKKAIGAGAIGGIVAGFVMLAPLMVKSTESLKEWVKFIKSS